MELSCDEREKLSKELWWSLHPPAEDVSQEEIDASWDAEIKRRVEEIYSGTAELIPGEQVIAELQRRITKRSTR
jgi:putative addiction module component (TIGR02574 family)